MSGEWRELWRTRTRQFFQRRPLVAAALMALVVVVAVDFWSDAKLLASVVVLAATAAVGWIAWLGGRKVGGIVLIAALAAGGFHAGRLVWQHRLARQIQAVIRSDKTITLTGEVRRHSYSREGRWGGLVRLRDGRGTVWWNGVGDQPSIGQTVTARGAWMEARAARNPGEFPLKDWLWRMGTSGQFQALAETQKLEPLGPIRKRAEDFRAWFRNATVTGLNPEKAETKVIRAIVLGEIADDSDVLIHAYRNSGTLHVFSVSGLHVGMVGLMVWFCAKLMRVSRRQAAGAVILVMFAYAWVTGWTPPAARSAWMASLVVAGFLVRRPADVGNLLGAALLGTLLVDGHAIFQAGVQLSYGVVGVLLLAAQPAAHWMAQSWQPDPFLPRSLWSRWTEWRMKGWRKLCGGVGASAVATVGSAPLMIWHFRLLTPVAILAGVPIGIMVFFMLGFGFLAVALTPFSSDAAAGVNRLNAGLASWCTSTAGWCAKLPGGNFTVPPATPQSPYLLVYDLPYGGGASCWVDHNQATLCDCGSESAFKRTVLPSLRMLGAQPERLVLTHPDAGHIGGTLLGMETLPLREVWWPVAQAPRSEAYSQIQQQSREQKFSGGLFTAGQSWSVGKDTTLHVLMVPHANDAKVRADERTAILRWESHGWKILQISDAGMAIEQQLLKSGIDLRSDVLIMGRNPNDLTGSEAFLEVVAPRVVIAAHADFSNLRVPASLERWCERNKVTLFHQGRSGAVTVQPRADELKVEGFIDHKAVSLTR